MHEGKGTIVRLLEYLVGRANGQFLPCDEAIYSRKRRQENKNSFFRFNLKRPNSNNNVIAHETPISNPAYQRAKPYSNKRNSGYVSTSHKTNNLSRLSDPYSSIDINDDKLLHPCYAGSLNNFASINLRLQEFKILLNRRFPEYQASQFFEIVTCMLIMGHHDSFLNKVLASLRGEDNIAADLFTQLQLQPLSDKKVDQHMSPERYLQGKTKLAAVEQLLTPHYPKEFVQGVIRTLSNEFDVSGDLSALDEAFERHRNNVERYMRY
jgi:hypothetical protein